LYTRSVRRASGLVQVAFWEVTGVSRKIFRAVDGQSGVIQQTRWKSPVPDRLAVTFWWSICKKRRQKCYKKAELLISARGSPEIFFGF
jgi:hypothetical protein